MPCTYTIDKAKRLVLTTGWEVLTFEEAMAHQDQLRTDPDFSPDYSQLIDLTKVLRLPMDSEQVQRLASRTVFGNHSFRAFVGSSPAVYGMLRMAQAFRDLAGGKEGVAVFYDLPSALRWLKEVHFF